MYFFKKLFTVSSNLNGIKEFNDVNQEQGWEGRGLGFFFDFLCECLCSHVPGTCELLRRVRGQNPNLTTGGGGGACTLY